MHKTPSTGCNSCSSSGPLKCLLIRCSLIWTVAASAAALACARPFVGGGIGGSGGCCFRYRNWRNPCDNATCPNNALCVPAVNVENLYRCVCPSICWNVGDSEDSGEVCGSDGHTYPSLCHLMRASCHAVLKVNALYKGSCDPCADVKCPAGQRCGLDANRMPRCECEPCRTGQSSQRPVCGTDGRTYPDECSLDYDSCFSRLNISKLSDGRCPSGVHCQAWCPHEYMECRVDPGSGRSACDCPAECPPVLSPVCGTNDVTYDSECHLRRRACLSGRRGVRPAYRGQCEKPLWCLRQRQGGQCPYGGVCRVSIVESAAAPSSSGVAAVATWSVQASCERPNCLEPLMWLPGAAAAAEEAESRRVCGSDGVTYRSDCHLRQKAFDTQNSSLTVAARGSCNPCQGITCPFYGVCSINVRGKPVCQCPNSCLYVNNPVCGTDGLTYTLECDLRSYACNNRLDIRVASKGSCPNRRLQQQQWQSRRRRRVRRVLAARREGD